MNNVVDLQQEREINALIDRLGQTISVNPETAMRTFAALSGELSMRNEDAVMISVRVPKSLVEGIDDASREIAYREKRKVTRSSLITEWLDASYKAYLEEHSQ